MTVGQSRHEVPGRPGSVFGVRCTCCGQAPAAASVVCAVLRGIVYEYCGAACRDRHADALALQPERCEYCDLDAVGDTGRCAAHLDDEAGDRTGAFPLAS